MKARIAFVIIAMAALSLIPDELFAAQANHSKKRHHTLSRSHHATAHRNTRVATKVSTAQASKKPVSAPAPATLATVDAGDGSSASFTETVQFIQSKLLAYGGGWDFPWHITNYSDVSLSGNTLTVTFRFEKAWDADAPWPPEAGKPLPTDVACSGHVIATFPLDDLEHSVNESAIMMFGKNYYQYVDCQKIYLSTKDGEPRIHVRTVVDNSDDPKINVGETDSDTDNYYIYPDKGDDITLSFRVLNAIEHAIFLAQKQSTNHAEPF